MDLLHNIALGFLQVSQPEVLLLTVIGTAVGILVGAIPGLSATMAVAVGVPITFSMDTMPGLALLISLYVGGLTGGLISAILLKIPAPRLQ